METWTKVAADLGQAAAGFALFLGVLGGGWAYFKAKRREAAHWIFGVFQPFQIGAEFDEGKKLLDFEYTEIVEPLLGEIIFGCNQKLDKEAQHLTIQIDRVLNYLEHVCYLEKQGHILPKELDTYFGHWFDSLKHPDKGALRRYCADYGYHLLAAYSGAQKEEYIIFYGSFKNGLPDFTRLNLSSALILEGQVEVPGELYDLGDYPGLVIGDGLVSAELFQINDMSILRAIDEDEEWSRDMTSTLYRRVSIQVMHPGTNGASVFQRKIGTVDAWIYYYNQPVDKSNRIVSNCWSPKLIESD